MAIQQLVSCHVLAAGPVSSKYRRIKLLLASLQYNPMIYLFLIVIGELALRLLIPVDLQRAASSFSSVFIAGLLSVFPCY